MKVLFAFLTLIFAHHVYSADYYKIDVEKYSEIETKDWAQGQGIQIILAPAFPNWNTTPLVDKIGSNNSISPVPVLRINLTPPNGALNLWLSLILTAKSTGKSIIVYADKDGSSQLNKPSGADMRLLLE